MLRLFSLLLPVIILLSTELCFGRDDLITVTKESEQVPLATGKSVSVKSTCPENSVLVSGGGECSGSLNTESKIVLTRSAPDSLNAAWNVECSNMNPQAGDAQAKAWAICSEY